ncbi:MAG TPA: M14 family zinc carboxypeptidase [Actinomycetes bacterium]|nr:M14 family zinc carboxypeptidase [Actinomycetes bacterium]
MRLRLAHTTALAAAVGVAAALLLAGPPTAAAPGCAAFDPPEFSGQVPSPTDVLGFDLGTQETSPRQIVSFVNAVDEASDRVTSGVAATSVAGRPLTYAVVGDPSRVTADALEQISRQANRLRNPTLSADRAAELVASTPAILWVSGNVHGTEESGADGALRVLYELADRTDCVVDTILDNAIVVVLPTQNPDGRFWETRRNLNGFDMNRDWFARTQPETDGKLELLRTYPPMLYVDAHEFGYSDYLFPPHADPEYHETPDTVHDWIFDAYGPTIEDAFDAEKLPYHHGAPYDFFATIFGDTVPAMGFHAAGMTFEKDNRDLIEDRTFQQYLAMWASVFQGATGGTEYVRQWHESYVTAYNEGVAGQLEPNAVYNPKSVLQQQVPDVTVRHYFLRYQPRRAYELDTLVRRLQRMDVDVYRLTQAQRITNFTPYGDEPRTLTMPIGSYWIPMAQGQKHWIQAMLHRDTYIPAKVTYDVTAWSNPLLLNIKGGYTGDELTPQAQLLPPEPSPSWDGTGNVPAIGIYEIPGSTRGFEASGQLRYVFESMWNLPYRNVTTNQILNGLNKVDVLVIPDGYSNYATQALGAKGKRALRQWVSDGGRLVTWQGGTRVAIKSGASGVRLTGSKANAPGTLVRTVLDPRSPLADGVGRTVWVLYDNDDLMTSSASVGSFPAPGSRNYATAGQAENMDSLAGSSFVADEQVDAGRVISFSVDPNFRAWTLGMHRILWNALVGPDPGAAAARSATLDKRAIRSAKSAERATPEVGQAMRIAVPRDQATDAKAAIRSLGLKVHSVPDRSVRILIVDNLDDLGLEESRRLSQVMPTLKAASITIKWANLPGP